MALDVIFSLDSVITAVGMVNKVGLMVSAIVVSIVVMMFFAKAIGDFVHEHPTVKMLALAFLLMIGVMLIADGLGHHIPKGYIYFSMAFSLFVEMLNLRAQEEGSTRRAALGVRRGREGLMATARPASSHRTESATR